MDSFFRAFLHLFLNFGGVFGFDFGSIGPINDMGSIGPINSSAGNKGPNG